MELNLLFVLLFLHPALGLVLDVRVPPSLSAELGSNVSLPCTFTVDESPLKLNFLALLWKFGDLDIFTRDNKRKYSNPRVVFNEGNVRKGDATLVLQNVSTSDEGSYTCTVVYSPESQTRQTQLTVYALPTISNLEKLGDQLLCSVTGFYPKDISVLLLMDRTVMSSSVLASYQNIDGTYGINISAPFTEMEKSKSFSCKVEYKYLPSPLEKHVQLVEGTNESGFNVFLLVGILVALVFIGAIIGAVLYYRHKKGIKSFIINKIQGPDTWVDGEKITLYCPASHCTKDVQATWIIKNKDGTMCEITDSTKVQSEEEEPLMAKEYEMTNERTDKPVEKGSCDFTTSLSFIPSVSRHLDSSIICRFVCGKEKAERTFQFKSIYAKPKILEPVIFTLCEPDDVQLSLNLQSFYPQNIQISWSCDGKESREDRTSEDELKNNPDKTFSIQSKCKIPGYLFKDPAFKVRVTWHHEPMESPESREVSVRDFPWCPEIEDIPIESNSNSNKLNYKITKYFPDALTVTWFKKEGNKDLVPISTDNTYEVPAIHSQKQADGTFTCNACLVIKVLATHKQHEQFVCRVEHPSLKKPLQTAITALQDNETFKVSNIHGPKKWIDGEKVTLYCTASYCPEDVQVTWVITEHDGTVREVSELAQGKDNKGGKVVPTGYVANRERTETSDKEGLTDFTTSLSFTPSIAKHKDITLICRFVCGGTSKEKQFQLESLFAKPKVLEPIKLSLSSTGEVLCSFIVKEFYPKNIQINWSYGGKNHQENKTSNETFTEHNLTWNVQTKCKVPGHLFKDKDFTVILKWKHKSMDGCKTKQISVRDFPWEPEIREIPIPSIFNNKPATLMCTVSNVFPDSLTVKWLRKERQSNKSVPLSDCDKYKIPDNQREKHKDGTFIYKSRLTFIPSVKTDQGAEFICKVDHPKLKKKQTKSTGPLQITALPDVKNICNPEDGIFTLEVDSFYPENITISWKLTLDSTKEENITHNSSVKSDMYDNGSFRAISTCDLRKNDLIEGKSYGVIATVEHETLDSPIHKSFNMERAMTLPSPVDQKQNQECTTPTMQDNVNLSIQPTDHQRSIINAIQGPQVWTNGEKVCLYLTASYCTKDVMVTWIITERDGSVWEIPDTVTEQTSNTNRLSSGYEATRESTDKSDKEGLLDIVSCLTVVPSVSKHSAMTLACKVICEGEVKEKQYTLQSIHAKPKVLDPIKLSLCDSGEVMYSLNLLGFYPKDIDICWECGTDQSLKSLKSQEHLQENSDMTFNVQSECKVTGKSLKNPNFKVRVTWKHSSMDVMEFREMSATDADFPWRPEIQAIPISHVINGREVTVQYNIYKYFPDALTVRWFRKERGGQELFPLSHSENLRISDLTHKKQSDNTYTCTACLLFTPSLSSDQGAEFICRVEHPSLEQPIERGTGALVVISKPKITGPLTLGICDHSNLQCSLNLTNVYPKDIQITWLYRSSQYSQEGSPEPVSEECADHTFNVTSTCTIPVHLFIDPASNICVKWKHEAMDDPESKELSVKDPGFPWRPEMEDIVIPTLLPNEQVRLQCKISHYFPDVLTVTWFKRKKGQQERQLVPNEKYNIPDIQSVIQADQSYTCTTHVIYTPSVHAEQEAEFICKVDHPSLVQPITKCTGMIRLVDTPFIQPEIQSANYGNNIHSFNGQQHPFPQNIDTPFIQPEIQSANYGNNIHSFNGQQHPFPQNIDTPFSQPENQFTSPGHNLYLVNNEEHVYLQDTEMKDLNEATYNQTRSTDEEMEL
ncbi:uncharacterized protein LOC128641937 [Bombina bombina]|uniref:uncharacterized protein LOC128641937 n=1 Tax=Bombina bombina TaxID=8345 RepID=UPI00235AB149|nr:uncharacterized protein LOC128641937 [Bombina bombina]